MSAPGIWPALYRHKCSARSDDIAAAQSKSVRGFVHHRCACYCGWERIRSHYDSGDMHESDQTAMRRSRRLYLAAF